MSMPLEGFRILQLGQAVASPYLASLCGSLGADVIKIENRRRPDNMRYVNGVDPAPNPLDGGLLFNAINLNTRSALLDLTMPEGRALFLELVKTADAVAENYAAGTMERFGLGYEALRRVRPDLVMISLSGFGATGPLKDCVAYGIVVEGMAGMMHAQGYREGRPLETPFTYNDYISALYGTHLLISALYRRMHTGEGLYADFAESEITLHLVHQGVLDWMLNGRNQERQGNWDDFYPIHGCYPCRGEDAWVAVVAGADDQWQGLCRAIGREDWLSDPRLRTREGRMAHREELEAGLRAWTRQRTPTEVMQALQRHGVPAGPAYQVNETLADPHVRARGVVVKDSLHPHTKGRLVAPLPLRMTGVPREVRMSAPTWGNANRQVYGELLGLPAAEIVRLETAGVLT